MNNVFCRWCRQQFPRLTIDKDTATVCSPAESSKENSMARLNILNIGPFARPRTHEGAPAKRVSNEAALRRAVLACMLWEDQFYEDGVAIAGRIAELVPKVSAFDVAGLAVEAREKMKLRHAPLLLAREMARQKTHRRSEE